jgi:hypothetical protein
LGDLYLYLNACVDDYEYIVIVISTTCEGYRGHGGGA